MRGKGKGKGSARFGLTGSAWEAAERRVGREDDIAWRSLVEGVERGDLVSGWKEHVEAVLRLGEALLVGGSCQRHGGDEEGNELIEHLGGRLGVYVCLVVGCWSRLIRGWSLKMSLEVKQEEEE